MPSPSTTISAAERINPNKERVEAHLRELQEKGSLALHIWEDFNPNPNGSRRIGAPAFPPSRILLPEKTLERLRTYKAEDIPQCITDKTMPFHSVSPLPPASLHIGMKPFMEFSFSPHMGYLFNLDQSHTNSARISIVSPHDIYSAYAPDCKIADFRTLYNHPLGNLYRQEWGTPEALLDVLATPEGAEATQKQLGWLTEHYRRPSDQKSVTHSEALAAVSSEHIAAIVVPCLGKAYENNAILNGVFSGLAHLRAGIDVPVVLYHYHENGPHLGTCTYVGQGREELVTKALDTLETEITSGSARHLFCRAYSGYAREMIGLDLTKPPKTFLPKIAELRERSSALALPSHDAGDTKRSR